MDVNQRDSLLSVLRRGALPDGSVPTASTLGSHFECSERTIRRWIKELQSSGYAIHYDKHQKQWVCRDSSRTLQAPRLSPKQMSAVFIAQRSSVMYRGTPLEAEVRRTLGEIVASAQLYYADSASKYRFEDSPGPLISPDVWEAINIALGDEDALRLTYKSPWASKVSQHLVVAHSLLIRGRDWQLLAERLTEPGYSPCGHLTLFYLPRIESAQAEEAIEFKATSFDIDAMMACGFNGVPGTSDTVEQVQIFFPNAVAHEPVLRPWHTSQTVAEQRSGITITFCVAEDVLFEVARQVLRWGESGVRAVAPPALVKCVYESAMKLIEGHKHL